jgi:AraC-like DNA-binding protein
MDKTDIKWYNTDMNDIIFAGNVPNKSERDLHSHKGYEIICAESDGEIKSSENFSYKQGEIIIIPPLIKHSHVACKSYLSVVLEHALLPIKSVLAFAPDNFEAIAYACKQAEFYFHSDRNKFYGVVNALGELIAAYVAAYASGSGYSPVVKTVMADIDKNVSSSAYSLEDCIGALPLNYDYVRKLFKKETGLTPHEYLLKSRMELAKSIICSGVENQYSRYTVSQVAEMCGFSEPLYFSRVFKKYFGYPPSQQLK